MAFTSDATIKLSDGRTVRLGCKIPAVLPQRLSLSRYVNLGAVVPPESTNWRAKALAALAEMYGNEKWGDCVIAGMMHHFGLWTGNDLGAAAIGTEAEAYAAYQTICGPGDNGCYVQSVLDYAATTGITVGGRTHKIDGAVSVDHRNVLLTKVAVVLFGGVGCALNLPPEWASASQNFVWDVPKRIRSVGGHYVVAIDFNAAGPIISTWGMTGTMTWRAWQSRIVVDCPAIVSKDWYNDDLVSPSLVKADELLADLAKIKGGEIPPLPQPTPPIPPVPPAPPPSGFWAVTEQSDRRIVLDR